MLTNTESSLPTSKLRPYHLGLTWGMQDYARGTYSIDNARHLAESYSADTGSAGPVLEGYSDAEDDTWAVCRHGNSTIYTQY
jgi:hypothetical protein